MVLSNAAQEGKPSVSVIVPAFNEELNLVATVESIHKALEGKFSKYEVVIVNDGSRDDTGKIAETLAEQDSYLRVIHNPHNMGYGFTFMRGVEAASCEYVQLIPADGEIPTGSIETIANHIGMADMVIPYMLNFHIRPLGRRIISWGYTTLLNILFGMRLHYYNGPFVIRRNLIKTVPVNTSGFAFMASILLRLIKRKHTFVEVGIMLEPRQFGKSSLSLRKIASVVKSIARLFWDINIAQRLGKARYKLS